MRVQRVLTVGAIAVGIAASALAAAPAASAKAAPTDCPNTKLCVYESNDYEGGILVIDVPTRIVVRGSSGSGQLREVRTVSDFKVNDLSGRRFNNGHPVNDNISSVANKTAVDLRFFKNANLSGEQFQLPHGEFFSTVGLQNDSFSSVESRSH